MFKYVLLALIAVSFTIVGCDNKASSAKAESATSVKSIDFPVPIEKSKTKADIILTVANNSGQALDYLWWTKEGENDWVIAKTWSTDNAFTFTPNKPGIYAFQVDYRNKLNPADVTKKWLGQTSVSGE